MCLKKWQGVVKIFYYLNNISGLVVVLKSDILSFSALKILSEHLCLMKRLFIVE